MGSFVAEDAYFGLIFIAAALVVVQAWMALRRDRQMLLIAATLVLIGDLYLANQRVLPSLMLTFAVGQLLLVMMSLRSNSKRMLTV